MAADIEAVRAEIARRKEAAANPQLARVRQELANRRAQGEDLIATAPIATGDPRVDQAGQVVDSIAGGGPLGISQVQLPAIEDLEFDDPVAVKAQRAAEGVDFSTGLNFADRAAIARSSNIPRQRADTIQRVLGSRINELPPQLQEQAFRYDSLMDDWQFLAPDQNEPGKYRWTSLDGSGVEFADVADMLNPAEFLSMLGSVAATGAKGKAGNIFALGRQKGGRMALQGLMGGLTGRTVGELVSIGETYMRTGDHPTWDEMRDLGLDSAAIEAFATATGELGAKIMGTASASAQEAYARRTGRTAVDADPAQIALHNKNLAETQADMQRVAEVLGRHDMPTTQGSATHSVDLIEAENFGIANAAKKTQRAFNRAMARGKRTTQEYIDAVWGGNQRWLDDSEAVIASANDSISDAGITVAQNINGDIYFVPKPILQSEAAVMTDTGAPYGVKAMTGRNPDYWAAQSYLPDDARGIGLGKQSYEAAINEATAYGKGLQSDYTVTDDAAKVWEALKKDGYQVQKNPDAVYNEGLNRWESDDWVFRVEKPPSVTEELLPKLQETGYRPTGEGKIRAVEGADLADFIRTPRSGLKTVQRETDNPFIMQEWREAVLEDYERSVIDPKTGRPDMKAFEKWKAETGKFRDAIFDDLEFARTNRFGGLREVVEEGRGRAQSQIDTLARTMRANPADPMFVEPSQRRMYNQLKKLTPAQRRRTMTILRRQGNDAGIMGLLKEEIRLDLLQKSKGSAAEGFEKWRKDTTKLIQDVMDPQVASRYSADLRTVGNILKRRSDRMMVTGTAADANPTALGLTRVIFGPLSRTQRFFSAARKGQVRSSAAEISDIITEPALLRELVQLRMTPVTDRRVMRLMQETGLIDDFWFDADNFDIDNPEHRQRVADEVMIRLQGEFDEEVER